MLSKNNENICQKYWNEKRVCLIILRRTLKIKHDCYFDCVVLCSTAMKELTAESESPLAAKHKNSS